MSAVYRLSPPSPIPEVGTNEIPKIIDEDDINAVKDGFARGAKLLVDAGFDGIEINAAQYSLMRQFLSPLTNMRNDQYGGSLENRASILCEILKTARDILGNEHILGLRLCGDEYAPWGGLAPEDWAGVAAYLETKVKIDYIAVENGSLYSTHMTHAGIYQPENYAVEAASIIAEKTTVPVIAGGSLCTPSLIDETLSGKIALADITRALIADPLFAQKLAQNQEDQIMPCILCKFGCHTHALTNSPIACSVNPSVGIETKIQALISPIKALKIAIAGGGPAGLMAAATAAENGHKVTLFEKEQQLGGSWLLNSKIPGHERYGILINHLQKKLKALKAEIRLGEALTMEEALKYDKVIVATGCRQARKSIETDSEITVTSAEKVIAKGVRGGKRALVWDTLGDWRAPGACEILACAGLEIVLITPDMYLAAKTVKNGEFSYWYKKVSQLPITAKVQSYIKYAGKDKVIIADKFTGAEETLPGVDILIEAVPGEPENELWLHLQNQGVELSEAGDCIAPRNLMSAIREGYFAGLGVN